jgi:YgiT-type zinc finger domain-containing protein
VFPPPPGLALFQILYTIYAKIRKVQVYKSQEFAVPMKKSFQCTECNRGIVRSTYISQQVKTGEKTVTVKGVPVGLCPYCGKKYQEDHVLERVNQIAASSTRKKSILYTNEDAIPGDPDAAPENVRAKKELTT